MTLREHLHKIKKSSLRLSTILKIVTVNHHNGVEIRFDGHKFQVGYLLSTYFTQEYLSNEVCQFESYLISGVRHIVLQVKE